MILFRAAFISYDGVSADYARWQATRVAIGELPQGQIIGFAVLDRRRTTRPEPASALGNVLSGFPVSTAAGLLSSFADGIDASKAPVSRLARVAPPDGMVGAFDDAAEIHHRHTIGKIANHQQIVRNAETSAPEIFLEIDRQIENLRLDREIERRYRFVANHELGARRTSDLTTRFIAVRHRYGSFARKGAPIPQVQSEPYCHPQTSSQ